MSASQTSIPKKQPTNDLTQKELAVLRKASNFSDKEIQLWHKGFLEAYPTGKMDKATFTETFKTFHPQESQEAIDRAFHVADQNNDGTIDFKEFLFCAAVGNRVSSVDDRLELIFELWDVSNDGQLDVNELAHLISAMYDRAQVSDRQGEKNPTNRAKTIMKQLDISGDRKLSREEFLKGLKADQVILDLLDPK